MSAAEITFLPELATGLDDLYDTYGAVIWLFAANPSLNGESAAEVLLTGDPGRVLALIDQLRSGAFI